MINHSISLFNNENSQQKQKWIPPNSAQLCFGSSGWEKNKVAQFGTWTLSDCHVAETLSQRSRAAGRPNDSLFSLASVDKMVKGEGDRGWGEKENNSDE